MVDLWVATSEGLLRNGEPELNEATAALERSGDSWWAVVGDHEVWRRDPSGKWGTVATYQPQRLTCLRSVEGRVLAGTSEAHLVWVGDGGAELVDSFETVAGRDNWYTPWGGPPDVRSIATDESGAIFVNIHVGGIARSSDGTETWSPTIDIHSDVHEVATGTGVIASATAWGLALSRDGGDNWDTGADGLHASYARAVALSGSTIFLTASDGPFGGRAALYRRELDGGSFTKCEDGLPEWVPGNINSACLATSGPHVAFGTEDGRVYVSADSGLTWSQAAKDLPEIRAVRLA